LRKVRKSVTSWISDTAVRLAPRLSPAWLRRLENTVATWGPHTPILARHIAANMRAAGIPTPPLAAHFRWVGAHLAGALLAQRCAADTPADGLHPEMLATIAQRFTFDASWAALQGAPRPRIIMSPHICNYLLFLAAINRRVPLTVYLRHSKDPRKNAAKERWYRASGVDWVAAPASATGTLGRLRPLANALRENRTVFITPDLPQPPERGTPVRFFDRIIYLPAGAALLAARAEVDLWMLAAQPTSDGLRLTLRGPLHPPERAEWRTHAHVAMQWYADLLEHWLRDAPELWYLWGDKRWTRVWQRDPAYCATPPHAPPEGAA
jgi:hypothetical protein